MVSFPVYILVMRSFSLRFGPNCRKCESDDSRRANLAWHCGHWPGMRLLRVAKDRRPKTSRFPGSTNDSFQILKRGAHCFQRPEQVVFSNGSKLHSRHFGDLQKTQGLPRTGAATLVRWRSLSLAATRQIVSTSCFTKALIPEIVCRSGTTSITSFRSAFSARRTELQASAGFVVAHQICRYLQQPGRDTGGTSKLIAGAVRLYKAFLRKIFRGFPVPKRCHEENEKSEAETQ